ncbi:MAG TPA: hypothetical protein VGX28_14335 [Frankiaceae bacterium]|jgi:hypothetical protein|nr:hypothetical protein [Frankiaceae bacterium]
MTPLERRCRRLARAYPDGTRAEEVVTTLMDTNEGRRAPRVADAVDVVRHGVMARLGDRSAGTAFGRWGDAASIALVCLLAMQAAAACAMTYRLFAPTGNENPTVEVDGVRGVFVIFPDPVVRRVAVVVCAVAVAAFVAACLGRVRTTRALVAATVVAGAAAVVTARARDVWAFRSTYGAAVVAIAVAVAGCVLFTGAVARAKRAAPPAWWGTVALVTPAVAVVAVDIGRGPFGSGRIGVALTAYAGQALALLVFATPYVRDWPQVFAAAALLAMPAVPWAAAATNDDPVSPLNVPVALGLTTVAWVVIAGAATLALRRVPAAAASD